MSSNINEGHAKGRRSVKKGHVQTKPKSGPVKVSWFNPLALAYARKVVADASNSYTVTRVESGEVWVR